MNKIEKIHADFRGALELSKVNSNTVTEKIYSAEHSEKLQKLQSLGFTNSATTKATKEKLVSYVNIENNAYSLELLNLEKFQAVYPKYRLIGLNAVFALCQKYNLYIGHNSLYTHSIPDKNLLELAEHKEIEAKTEICFLKDVNSISELIEMCKGNKAKYTSLVPASYFVIAPRSYFDKDAVVINRTLESIPKPKLSIKFGLREMVIPDPIVVTPLSTHQTGVVFQIATAWGNEAEDSQVTTKVDTNITTN